MKKMLLCGVAALGLLGLGACGGDSKDKDDGPEVIVDAGDTTGGGGTHQDASADEPDAAVDVPDAALDVPDANTDSPDANEDAPDANGNEPGGDVEAPEDYPACDEEDGYGDLSEFGGESYGDTETYNATYYDYGDGFWEVEWSSDGDNWLWVDVNNGDDADTAIGVGIVGAGGTYELGRIEYDEYLYCFDAAYYAWESDEMLPAACAGAAMADGSFYEMFSGTLTLTKLSAEALAGSVSDGYFMPWESVDYDASYNETWCYLPPISFSFDVTLEAAALE